MTLALILLSTLLSTTSWQDHAAKGKSARKNGDCVNAIRHYLAALNAPDIIAGAQSNLNQAISSCKQKLANDYLTQAESAAAAKHYKDARDLYQKSLSWATVAFRALIKENSTFPPLFFEKQ